MKKTFQFVCVGACIVAALFTSCKKQDFSESSSAGSSSKAMEIYEQHKAKFSTTKSVNIQDIVKPLPGDFTPLWEQASERQVGSDLITTIPIKAQVNYVAVYPCSGSHGHEQHSHDEITVVQKLVVIQTPNGSECYIANIVPFEGCTINESVINESFVIGDELAGFNGFVAYHNLNGAFQKIIDYDNGIEIAVTLASSSNAIEITKDVKLYIRDLPTTKQSARNIEIWQKRCSHCSRYCGEPYFGVGGGFENYDKDLDRLKKHCGASYAGGKCTENNGCRELHGSMYCKCTTFTFPEEPTNTRCKVCQTINCNASHKLPPCAYCASPDCKQWMDFRYAHIHVNTILNTHKSLFNQTALHNTQYGCSAMDEYNNNQGDEYKHNLTTEYEHSKVANEKRRLKDFIIRKIRSFKQYNDFMNYGEALHTALDILFLTVPQRVNMLNYYSYSYFYDIIPTGHPDSGLRETMYERFVTLTLNLPANPSDSSIEDLIDMLDASLMGEII